MRLALLLANRALVVSERADPEDEAEYGGIVRFAALEEMPSALAALAALAPAAREAEAERTRTLFQKRFSVGRIFRQARLLGN